MQFTVIVPVYKVEKYLENCVDSILKQTFTDFEVILVDDGSPDNCPQICDAFKEKDPRVRVIHKPNGGLVSARNAGIAAAQGDFITYVDGDDWIKPNLLQFVHDRMAESAVPVDMVIFAAEKVYSDHTEVSLNGLEKGWYDRNRLEKEVFPNLLSDRRNGFAIGEMIMGHTWNKPCRRELQTEHYVRDEQIRIFTDVPMTYECLLNCQNVYICNEPLYMYNQINENSLLTLGREYYLTDSFCRLVDYMQKRMTDYGPSVAQQLNDYPVHLIIRTAMREIQRESSFRQAVLKIREGLKKTRMLQLIHLKGLPFNPRLLILLFKLHLYMPAMVLCAFKRRQGLKK